MKTISMDYEEYREDLLKMNKRGFEDGFSEALSQVFLYLIEDTNFKSFWKRIGEEDNVPNPKWERILYALGKKEEWQDFINPEEDKPFNL